MSGGDYDPASRRRQALTVYLIAFHRRKAPLPRRQEAGYLPQVRRLPHCSPRCKPVYAESTPPSSPAHASCYSRSLLFVPASTLRSPSARRPFSAPTEDPGAPTASATGSFARSLSRRPRSSRRCVVVLQGVLSRPLTYPICSHRSSRARASPARSKC